MRQVLFLSFIAVCGFFISSSVAAEDTYSEEVTIIAEVADLAGSGKVISNEDLQKAMDTDNQKILTAVPGLYMRTEEG